MTATPEHERKWLLIHLPFTYFCPNCRLEQNHVWLCPVCLKYIPGECDDDKCVDGFDLYEVKRGH